MGRKRTLCLNADSNCAEHLFRLGVNTPLMLITALQFCDLGGGVPGKGKKWVPMIGGVPEGWQGVALKQATALLTCSL